MHKNTFKLNRFYVKNNNPYYDASKLIINLRGHVRDSFNTPQLYIFLKMLSNYFTLKIYIHTWNIKSNHISWKKVNKDKSSITEQDIRDYFKDLPITSILIDDDAHIELIGNKQGKMFSSYMPKIGWKNMWYGMYKTMEEINKHEPPNVLILNTRFDVFTNSCKVSEYNLLNWIQKTIHLIKYQKIHNNYLMYDTFTYGMDNQMIGDKHTLYKLIYHFHHHLDEINQLYSFLNHQEFSVHYENIRLF